MNGLPVRRSQPPSIPPIDPDRAKARHRDGMSCWTVGAYTYDANGYRRWCIDCGEPLGEQSWVEDGADVPNWLIGFVIAAVGVLLALVVFLAALPPHGTNQEPPGGTGGGVRATPSPYGPPGPQGGPVR